MSFVVANESSFDEGYDSDSQMGPFFEAVNVEGDQLFEEFPPTILSPPGVNKSNAPAKPNAEGDRDSNNIAGSPVAAPEVLKEKQAPEQVKTL